MGELIKQSGRSLVTQERNIRIRPSQGMRPSDWVLSLLVASVLVGLLLVVIFHASSINTCPVQFRDIVLGNQDAAIGGVPLYKTDDCAEYFVVPQSTRVRVLRSKNGLKQVQVTSSTEYGRTGWLVDKYAVGVVDGRSAQQGRMKDNERQAAADRAAAQQAASQRNLDRLNKKSAWEQYEREQESKQWDSLPYPPSR